jgi:glycosyltransferase involved in cell wall biosynthesis
MRIGIEGQRLFRNKKHGMDMVALELIRNLQKIDRENEYFIFVKPDSDRTAIKETDNFSIVELKGGPYPVWEQIILPQAARRYKCDILHCTSNTAPLFSPVPVIITLHDIIYMEKSLIKILTGSGSYYQRFGNIYRKLVVPGIINKCRKIITVSKFEKQRISEFFRLTDSDKLEAVYNGVGDYFRPEDDAAGFSVIKKKYNLPDNYFFFLGNTDPKKNTRGVLKAYSDFIQRTGSDIKLVMIDYQQDELRKLAEEIGNPGIIDSIHLTGYIVNSELPAIYRGSSIFLYPSLRESFGIPILEAMACGVPVITSNTSSMPEIAGDAAVLVDPYNPAEITNAMISIISDPAKKNELKIRGMERAAGFSWKVMAEGVLDIYKKAVGTND